MQRRGVSGRAAAVAALTTSALLGPVGLSEESGLGGLIGVGNAADVCESTQLLSGAEAAYSLAWHPEGEVLASASADGTVRTWDARTFEALKTIDAHPGGAWSVAWSPAGRLLASGSGRYNGLRGNPDIRIWSLPES